MKGTLTSAPATQAERRPARRRLVVILATMAAAALVWVIVEAGVGYDLWAPAMGSPGMDIGAGAVLISSGVAGLAAWGSPAALERWSRRPRLIWTILATVVFLISLGGPLSGEGIDIGNRAALAALHAVVAMGLIPGLAATTEGVRL